MNDTDLLPAPELTPPPTNKWLRERQAFRRLLPQLLASHRGQYVAIHGEAVVDCGEDLVTLADRVYARFGYQPIYCDLVSDEGPARVRIPSPRLPRCDAAS